MELTKTYQRIITSNIYYDGAKIGELRTYGKYTNQVNNITTYMLKQTLTYSGVGTFDYGRTTSSLDGTTKVYTSARVGTGGEVVLSEITRTATHGTDGTSPTKSVSSSFTAKEGISATGSTNITFPKINRYAYIAGTLTSATDESTFYFDFNNPLGLDISCWLEVNPIGTHLCERNNVSSATSGRYTWELTTSEIESLQSELTNSNTGTIRIGIRSTISGTSGSSYKDIPFSIINANPTFNCDYQDINLTTVSITHDYHKIIRNKSSLQVLITGATALKEATLTNASCTINGTTYTSSIVGGSCTFDIGTLDLSSNTDAILRVNDSRGNHTEQILPITILNYETPNAIITLQRKQNFYSETYLTVDANYSSLDNLNTIAIQYRYKKTSDSTWGSWTNISDNVQTTINIDNRYAWDFEVKLTDLLEAYTYTDLIVKVGTPKFFIDRQKQSVSVYCLPQYNYSVEVNGVDISNTYTTNERPIGRWIDNTIIYRKVVDTGSIASTSKSVAHSITNLDTVINLFGMCKASNGRQYTLPRIATSSTASQVELDVSSTDIIVNAGSSANFDSSFVIIEYTKSV